MSFMSKYEIEVMSEEIKLLQERTGLSKPEIFTLLQVREQSRIADALQAIQKCLEDITGEHSLYVYANGSINVD